MKDELFGQLNYDYLWEGKTQIRLYETEYELNLNVDGEEDEEIKQIQKESFIFYKKYENNIAKQIEEEIYNYYKSIYKYIRERNDVNILKKAPDVTNYLDIKKLIKPITLCIPYLDDDENREIDILFECTWDFDLGMGVRIINEKVTKIGIQSDVL
ncbi:DUF6985 domain-containing protein [Clostridium felsineum]|uniref:DUF6985 domain-containing protein n=1 Tax=Clostridium felsineum TaxID=36839 RepID=UPI00098C3B15|nr:hypothetical protein [Clostridium felsineum]URZ17981.1 hypothetical protein CLFE_040360 [Clostridium felsineum DSM 794]